MINIPMLSKGKGKYQTIKEQCAICGRYKKPYNLRKRWGVKVCRQCERGIEERFGKDVDLESFVGLIEKIRNTKIHIEIRKID